MTDTEIIAAFGGAASLARELKIKPPAISYWKRKGIPALRLIQLKALRPEVFIEATVQDIQSTVTISGD
jgi:hypothetical protein